VFLAVTACPPERRRIVIDRTVSLTAKEVFVAKSKVDRRELRLAEHIAKFWPDVKADKIMLVELIEDVYTDRQDLWERLGLAWGAAQVANGQRRENEQIRIPELKDLYKRLDAETGGDKRKLNFRLDRIGWFLGVIALCIVFGLLILTGLMVVNDFHFR